MTSCPLSPPTDPAVPAVPVLRAGGRLPAVQAGGAGPPSHRGPLAGLRLLARLPVPRQGLPADEGQLQRPHQALLALPPLRPVGSGRAARLALRLPGLRARGVRLRPRGELQVGRQGRLLPARGLDAVEILVNACSVYYVYHPSD